MQRAIASGLLRKRSWIGGEASLVLGPVVTIAACVAMLWWGRYLHENIRIAAILFLILIGTVATFLGNRRRGWPAVEEHVKSARRAWAGANGWRYVGQRTVDMVAIGLVLPRGWIVKHAIAALEGRHEGRDARVETWALKSAPGSKRRPSRREVVELAVNTGAVRLAAMRGGLTVDPTLIHPRWARPGEYGDAPVYFSGDREAFERWGEDIRAVVEAHEDLPFTVVVGADRVIVFTYDDPRPETVERRLALAVAIADIVDPPRR